MPFYFGLLDINSESINLGEVQTVCDEYESEWNIEHNIEQGWITLYGILEYIAIKGKTLDEERKAYHDDKKMMGLFNRLETKLKLYQFISYIHR